MWWAVVAQLASTTWFAFFCSKSAETLKKDKNICSKLTIKAHYSSISILDFEQVSFDWIVEAMDMSHLLFCWITLLFLAIIGDNLGKIAEMCLEWKPVWCCPCLIWVLTHIKYLLWQ